MTRQEISLAVDWVAEEGWNPGIHDADCFYTADPSGFLGFYIVKPEYRGRGYGIQIWNAGMKSLNGRTVGLDGVVAQQDNYRKSGFVLAYSNVRYQCVGGGDYPADAGIMPLSALDFADIHAYDKAFFPDDRREFLKCWINQPQSTALGIVRDSKLAGYGVLRICRTGFKVGPLFADSPECAERLFMALKSHVPESAPVFLDIPAVNAAAVELVNRHNMTVTFETARMYAGQIPGLPMERLFGVTSFELG